MQQLDHEYDRRIEQRWSEIRCAPNPHSAIRPIGGRNFYRFKFIAFAVGTLECIVHMLFSLCLFCSAIPFDKRPICRFCSRRLEARYLFPEQVRTHEWGFPLITLFDWGDELYALPRLVMALKEGENASLWFDFADVLSDQVGKIPDPLFIPIPSRRKTKVDHAYLWAKALNDRFGGEVRTLLKRVDTTAQKQKNKFERQKIHFELDGTIGNSFKTVILVDDLIASGSTMRAAISALQPLKKEVWGMGLVRRSLL